MVKLMKTLDEYVCMVGGLKTDAIETLLFFSLRDWFERNIPDNSEYKSFISSEFAQTMIAKNKFKGWQVLEP